MPDLSMATPVPDKPLVFHAEIPWAGPIVGAPYFDEGLDEQRVPLACVVDPGRGRAFGAVLVPVAERDGRYVALDASGASWGKVLHKSDAHGWIRFSEVVERWDGRIDGVLLVMLYNESRELQYYTYADLEDDIKSSAGSGPNRGVASLSVQLTPLYILPPIPDSLAQRMRDAVVLAVKRLLEGTPAKALRAGLAIAAIDATPKTNFVFALGSCQYPSAMVEGTVAEASYARLAKRLDGNEAPRPECLLLVGDQVYVDGTAGLFDPTTRFDRYVRPYEILYKLDATRDVLRRLPTFMLLDDHEITDNWEPRIDDTRPDPEMEDGRRSYFDFQRAAGPKRKDPVGDSRDPVWYDFEMCGFPFFMADTRTERAPRTANNIAEASIMSRGQFVHLRKWLRSQHAAHPDLPKFIASPSILLPRHRRAQQNGWLASALRSDGWDGYPRSFHHLLAFIAFWQIEHVVFLSGDEHLACVARATLTPPRGKPVLIHSVHSSPLFAPFPFANSEHADLLDRDEFDFDFDVDERRRGSYRCVVETQFGPPGDGFAFLHLSKQNGGWTMCCEFDRDPPSASASIERAI